MVIAWSMSAQQVSASEKTQTRQMTDLKLPGATIRTVEFSLSESRGRSASFEVTLTENGVVIGARMGLARQLMQAQREVVIALAIAEVRRSLGIPSDRLSAVYLDFSPGTAPGAQ